MQTQPRLIIIISNHPFHEVTLSNSQDNLCDISTALYIFPTDYTLKMGKVTKNLG